MFLGESFGCEDFVHVDKKLRTKIDAKSKKCILIRYGIGGFGYCLWDYESNKNIKSRDVFNEVMYKDSL